MGSWSEGFSDGFGDSMAYTVTLTWVDPTQRATTPPTPIAPDTFVIEVFDSAAAAPNTPIATVPQGVQTYTTGNLTPGVHRFTLAAVDSEGDISQVVPSVPAVLTVPLTAPLPPTNVAAKQNW
jgi:hypothetical protein